MAKTFDFTDKLTIDDSAFIKIHDKELEVKIDAETTFKALALSDDDEISIETKYKGMQDLLFTEESAKELTAMKLPFNAYKIVVEGAFEIALGSYGDDEPQGEQATQGMTS